MIVISSSTVGTSLLEKDMNKDSKQLNLADHDTNSAAERAKEVWTHPEMIVLNVKLDTEVGLGSNQEPV
jgi:hypothetical protein